ncbi:3-isopropylmalate dehydratase small subunit [Pectobacterium parmentieri]|uniref:3-isopropylmalate dehydratase small subunit n=1 Tax=Pectobacterium parmentieri TaxID=1905730 RepID=A0A8B3FA43_PECPM|nr:3-isopropylmalate dehydratase small subunit [Pectobacterium parmentieri]AOR59701.1 3-isopropylmalate dehydratase small subunit [Pectobacterium parmentieri]AYH00582.1 3-isopropylmalate dehydratase small subunit [Pectobacterium parmentieri]AYH09303.1 3-isopropylmalate dehydratase small subunit [Pectobacterium parmentieri]AYH19934.1 3-isopropylmalate dehydratase small subunit [Pectobacterium parmentieri]AYH26819.1 3-isopropylmalate dehydratase small subunit [Pectobacterium parmentieri]
MDTFKKISGLAAPMLAANIDTDVIMPKQFLKGIDRQGLDKGLFYDLRFNADGTENSDFILNTPQWKGSKFLVTGPNFGCGSSREHAVWGMKQLGIRALIGTSFAGIFNDNCLRNGVLTITLAEDKMSELARIISHIETNEILIDLENQIISTEKEDFTFNVDELKKEMLVQGLDAIGLTLSFKDEIIQFENEYYSENPWHKVS